jgi:hypothetical protein
MLYIPPAVFVQLHALTDLHLEKPPSSINFYMRLIVPTTSKDVVVMM